METRDQIPESERPQSDDKTWSRPPARTHTASNNLSVSTQTSRRETRRQTLGGDGAASNAVCYLIQARVLGKHFRWRGLFRQSCRLGAKRFAHLGIPAAFEEGRHANQANVVIPHHSVRLFVPWDEELVLKHCKKRVSLGAFVEQMSSYLRNPLFQFSGRTSFYHYCTGCADGCP